MKTITFRPIDEIARARAAECVAHGEWIPSETWARFHRACKAAGLDVEETYLAAKRDADAHICWIDDTTCSDCGGAR